MQTRQTMTSAIGRQLRTNRARIRMAIVLLALLGVGAIWWADYVCRGAARDRIFRDADQIP